MAGLELYDVHRELLGYMAGISDAAGNKSASMIAAGLGLKGLAHNRNIPAAAIVHPGTDATNTVTWTPEQRIREVTVRGIQSAIGDAFLVVINAPTAAIAKTWIEDNVSAPSQDVVYEMGEFNEGGLVIQRTTNILRLDVLPLSVAAMRFVVAAVGVPA